MLHRSNIALEKLLDICAVHLNGVVAVDSYEFASCYLWRDRPLFNDFGEETRTLRGDTIYLYAQSAAAEIDLFHELGHVVGRKHKLVGNAENGYQGSWETENSRLIARVTEQVHWSGYLNLFALKTENFRLHAASELWAELFMLWHLHPHSAEARLIDDTMESIAQRQTSRSIAALASDLRLLIYGL